MLGIYLGAVLKNMHQEYVKNFGLTKRAEEPEYISRCCCASVKIRLRENVGTETWALITNYYVCTKCNKPCDIKKYTPMKMNGLRKWVISRYRSMVRRRF